MCEKNRLTTRIFFETRLFSTHYKCTVQLMVHWKDIFEFIVSTSKVRQ